MYAFVGALFCFVAVIIKKNKNNLKMGEWYMWTLVSEKERRKYKIIEKLLQETKPTTIRELAEFSSSSQRGISYELKELKLRLEHLNGNIQSSSAGVTLYLPNHVGLDYFQRMVFDESPGFAIIEKIFFNENLNTEELMRDLFISRTTLFRLISKLDTLLKSYGLHLKTNPYKIVGDEMVIRNFYTTYFKERYGIQEWPFSNVNFDFLEQIMVVEKQHLDIPDGPFNHHYYRILFAVSITRVMNGYSVPSSYKLPEQLRIEQYHVLEKMMSEESITQVIPEKMRKLYFSELVDWEVYFSPPLLCERMKTNFHLKNNIFQLQEMVQNLCEIFQIPIDGTDYMIIQLNTAMEFFKLLPDSEDVFHHHLFLENQHNLNRIFENEYPIFYQTTKTMLSELCKSSKIRALSDRLEILMDILLSTWNELLIKFNKKYSTCRILVFSHETVANAEQLAQSLAVIPHESIEVEVFRHSKITQDTLSYYNFDILLSTCTLFLPIEQPNLYFNDIKYSGNYNYFITFVKEVMEGNKVRYRKEINNRINAYKN